MKDIWRQPRGGRIPQDGEFTEAIQANGICMFVIQPQNIRFTAVFKLVNAIRQATSQLFDAEVPGIPSGYQTHGLGRIQDCAHAVALVSRKTR